MDEKRKLLSSTADGFKKTLGRVADLVLLNLFFIICSLPIVTIGAALTASYSYLFRITRGDTHRTPYSEFFKDFVKALKKSTPVWLLQLLCMVILAGDFYYAVFLCEPRNTFFLVFSVVLGFIILSASVWIFPLIARYDNKLKAQIKNAFLMAVAHFPKTLLLVIVWVVCIVFPLLSQFLLYYLGWLWMMFGFSFPMFITALMLRKPFGNEPSPDDEEIKVEIPKAKK